MCIALLSMTEKSYDQELFISATPESVYLALTKSVNLWWTDSVKDASLVNSKITLAFGETYKTLEIKDLQPERRVLWECVDAHMAVESISDKREWVGTSIEWEINSTENGSRVNFLHRGLVPTFECYDMCAGGWEFFLGSFKDYLESGTGQPFKNA